MAEPKLKIERYDENPVHHKPLLTFRKSANGKYRFRVSRFAPNRDGRKPGQENLFTSQQFADVGNAEQGFRDALEAMLLVAWERNDLIDALLKTGLMAKIDKAL